MRIPINLGIRLFIPKETVIMLRLIYAIIGLFIPSRKLTMFMTNIFDMFLLNEHTIATSYNYELKQIKNKLYNIYQFANMSNGDKAEFVKRINVHIEDSENHIKYIEYMQNHAVDKIRKLALAVNLKKVTLEYFLIEYGSVLSSYSSKYRSDVVFFKNLDNRSKASHKVFVVATYFKFKTLKDIIISLLDFVVTAVILIGSAFIGLSAFLTVLAIWAVLHIAIDLPDDVNVELTDNRENLIYELFNINTINNVLGEIRTFITDELLFLNSIQSLQHPPTFMHPKDIDTNLEYIKNFHIYLNSYALIPKEVIDETFKFYSDLKSWNIDQVVSLNNSFGKRADFKAHGYVSMSDILQDKFEH